MPSTVALEQQACLFKLHLVSVHVCSTCTRPSAQSSLPQGQQTYLTLCMFDYVAQDQHIPGCVAQSITCLATDASLTVDPGVASLIPAPSHTFVGIDHELISMVILLPYAELFKKGCCQLQAKVCAQSTG